MLYYIGTRRTSDIHASGWKIARNGPVGPSYGPSAGKSPKARHTHCNTTTQLYFKSK